MLDAVLLGKTRSAVLREMFLNPDQRLSFNELGRRAKTGDGAVAREIKLLLEAVYSSSNAKAITVFSRPAKTLPYSPS